jgi:hypothetical protein
VQGKGLKRVFHQKKGLHKVVAEYRPISGIALNWDLNPHVTKPAEICERKEDNLQKQKDHILLENQS